METVDPSTPGDEIHLLTEWGSLSDRPRGRRAAVLSILIHGALVLAVVLAPAALWETPQMAERIITPLIAPLTELTQTDPNQGKVQKEFDVAASAARPRMEATPAPKPFQPAPTPPQPVAPPKPIALPEPPKVEEKGPKVDLPQVAQALAQPKIQPVERPKLVLEDPTAAPGIEPGQGRPLPKATADAALRGAMGEGSGGRGGLNLPPSSDTQPTAAELLSDPMGVDFRPYLAQITAAVKSYWMRIWPEAARQGRSGRVAIIFSVDRFGTVPKLIIASGSGTDALDLAAVEAISGSVPFPSLPRAYKSDQIRLQLNFIYNQAK